MTRKKIVIRVNMTCEKCRKQAMKIATAASGVSSVGIEGSYQDQLVVIGDGVDCAKISLKLRKKLRWAVIVSVQDVIDEPVAEPANNAQETPSDNPTNAVTTFHPIPYPFPHPNWCNPCNNNPLFFIEVPAYANPNPCAIQ